MLIHLAFFIAGLTVRIEFFSDGHGVDEETERHLAVVASSSADGYKSGEGKTFDNEYILFDIFQMIHLFYFIIQGMIIILKKQGHYNLSQFFGGISLILYLFIVSELTYTCKSYE